MASPGVGDLGLVSNDPSALLVQQLGAIRMVISGTILRPHTIRASYLVSQSSPWLPSPLTPWHAIWVAAPCLALDLERSLYIDLRSFLPPGSLFNQSTVLDPLLSMYISYFYSVFYNNGRRKRE